MSAPLSIFFNSGMPLVETVEELARLLSIDFRRAEERGLVRYEHSGIGYGLVLFSDHGLVDDRGIKFSRYEYQCDVDVGEEGVRLETAASLRRDIAAYLFEKIVQECRWPAMMVFNLQELVESFEPGSRQ